MHDVVPFSDRLGRQELLLASRFISRGKDALHLVAALAGLAASRPTELWPLCGLISFLLSGERFSARAAVTAVVQRGPG